MREPKFRGWNPKHNKRIYGYLFRSRGERFITEDGMVDNPLAEPEDWKVEPETVGQSTGAFDKKGVEIFEGDIVAGERQQFTHLEPCVVFYDQKKLGFYAKLVRTWEEGFCGRSGHRREYSVEQKHKIVIGNIHKNPELLS